MYLVDGEDRDNNCVPQPSVPPTQYLDAWSFFLMYCLPYRNFGCYESMVVMQAVEARPGVVGKWWYEIHRDDGEYSIEQQSTFSPACICDDGVNHWMGSMHGRRGRAGVVREAACWLVTVKPRAAAAAFASSMMPSSSSVTKVAVPTSTWTSLTPSTPPSAPEREFQE